MRYFRVYLKRYIVFYFSLLIFLLSCEKNTTEPDPIKLTEIISEVRIGNNIGTFVEADFPSSGISSAPYVSGTNQVASNGLLIMQVEPSQNANQLLVGVRPSGTSSENYLILSFGEQIFSEGYFVIDLPENLEKTTNPSYTLTISFNESKYVSSFILEFASKGASDISRTTLHSLSVNNSLDFKYSHVFTHIRPDGVSTTAEVGIWMFKTQELSRDAIANWTDKPYEGKTLYEPINVLWIDYVSDTHFEAKEKVEEFLRTSSFKPYFIHSDGYWGVFGDVSNPDWIAQNPPNQLISGNAWANTDFYSDNNHGRIFPGYITISSEGKFVFITTGAFSRETGGNLTLPLSGHEYISFNEARDALTVSGEWLSQRKEDFGNIYPLDASLNFSTSERGKHDGVRIFALYDCDLCEKFPPIGETLTFRSIENSVTFSTYSEKVDEYIAGYEVYRIRRSDIPEDFGIYYACDPDIGEMAVATDWWELGNPDNHGRDFYDPPQALPEIVYGAEVGDSSEWSGTLGEDREREVAKVIGYETISVPYRTFAEAMKVQVTSYDGDDTIYDDDFVWVSKNGLLVRAEDTSGEDAIVLINYSPPSNNLSKNGKFPGTKIYRNLSIRYLTKNLSKNTRQ